MRRREFIAGLGGAAAVHVGTRTDTKEDFPPSVYFGTPVVRKKKSIPSANFDWDCGILATLKAKISY